MTKKEAGYLGFEKAKEINKERHRLLRLEYDNNPKKCLFCNSSIKYEKRHSKFCNRSCAAILNGKLTPKRKRSSLPTDCPMCGSLVVNRHSLFCSIPCGLMFKDKEKHSKFEAGENLSHSVVRRLSIQRCLGFCQMCGLDQWLGKRILLILDHIDGDSSNSRLGNVRMLCSNCDAQTPTYKGKNIGNGRKHRMKRYYDDKS